MVLLSLKSFKSFFLPCVFFFFLFPSLSFAFEKHDHSLQKIRKYYEKTLSIISKRKLDLKKKKEIIDFFVRKYEDIDYRPAQGRVTFLFYALECDEIELASYLLDLGANPLEICTPFGGDCITHVRAILIVTPIGFSELSDIYREKLQKILGRMIST